MLLLVGAKEFGYAIVLVLSSEPTATYPNHSEFWPPGELPIHQHAIKALHQPYTFLSCSLVRVQAIFHFFVIQKTSWKPTVVVFGWPSHWGGADTKLPHLILLHEHCDLTVVPNHPRHLHDKQWCDFLNRHGAKYRMMERPSPKMNGSRWRCAMIAFLRTASHTGPKSGLKVIWSSEMMWHHQGEMEAIQGGVVDKILYTSELQKSVLQEGTENIPSRSRFKAFGEMQRTR